MTATRVARYVVLVERELPNSDFEGHSDGDHPNGHDGSDAAAVAQLALELQEAWDAGGVDGFFRVISRSVVASDSPAFFDVDAAFDPTPRGLARHVAEALQEAVAAGAHP